MTKKILSVSSWVVHGVYVALCLTVIVLCTLFSQAYLPTDFSYDCAWLALDMMGWATFIPCMPIGFILNAILLALHIADKKERKTSKIVWQSIRTALCPVLCVVMWLITVYIFVWTTGGV